VENSRGERLFERPYNRYNPILPKLSRAGFAVVASEPRHETKKYTSAIDFWTAF
jgi:hypothetical protein